MKPDILNFTTFRLNVPHLSRKIINIITLKAVWKNIFKFVEPDYVIGNANDRNSKEII